MPLHNIEARKLFLVDAFGALVSAFMLGVVLVRYEIVFRIPKNALYLLAFIPCVFVVFDLAAFYFGKSKWSVLLKLIALANICYCILSIVLALMHRESLSVLGWLYIIIEIVIIVYIAHIEYNCSLKID